MAFFPCAPIVRKSEMIKGNGIRSNHTEILSINLRFTVDGFVRRARVRDPVDRDLLIAGIKKAGLK